MKRNLLGSEMFGTTQIKTDEYILLAQTIVANGGTVKQAAIEINSIDEMLSIQRIAIIVQTHRFTATGRVRKNASLADMLSSRIDQQLKELKELELSQV